MTDWDLQKPVAREFIVGLDLGQARDFTALVVAERDTSKELATYQLPHIARIKDELYPSIVRMVKTRIVELKAIGAHARFPQDSRLRPRITLVIDYTGPGRPVADMFAEEDIGVPIAMVSITGGDRVTRGDNGDFRVPKRDLAAVVQMLLHSKRLTIAKGQELTPTLEAELKNFKAKISLTGHDSYGAGQDWRAGNHDDLVLGAALACWFGEFGVSDGWSDIAEYSDVAGFFSAPY